jgi:anti-sigma B factor antagonist
MKLTTRAEGDVTVITMDGPLDSSTAPGVQADLERLMPKGGTIVLDMSKMSYMSSAGLRILLLTYRKAQQTGTPIKLAGLPDDVREVMAVTGFLDFFTIVGEDAGIPA